MGDNLKIRKLRKDLTDVLNASLLPVEVKRMIFNDLNIELTNLAENEIQKELAEEQKESEEG